MSGNHGEHLRLDTKQKQVLVNGINTVIEQCRGLAFRPFPSARYPLPVTWAVYGEPPDADTVIGDVRKRLDENPVAVLEQFLVLVELFESNQPEREACHIDDDRFLNVCFRSKRNNGWAYLQGGGDLSGLAARINAPWCFEFFYNQAEPPSPKHQYAVPDRNTSIYYFLNMLFRYAFIYGRKGKKDAHDIGHFIEDFGPGVLVCHGGMTDLDWTLALAAMKMGVPALVPEDFPFSLGRKIVYRDEGDIVDGIVQFTNIRRLLDVPGIPRLPDYCRPEHKAEEFTPAAVYGDTDSSFCLMEPRTGVADGIEIIGTPRSGLGVLIRAEHPSLEGMDCIYIESQIIGFLSQIKGIRARKENNRLILQVGEGTSLEPAIIGEVLQKALKSEFPKIDKVAMKLVFEEAEIEDMAPDVKKRIKARQEVADRVNEDTISEFYYCVGCSPFAPDHVCILTPDRVPQCSRHFMQIRTGALFGYDDMTSIHHRVLHKDINSFGVLAKGTCLDPLKGEWSGINEHAAGLTDGRTPKVYLHTVFEHPTTGCGCFGIILFHIPEVDGIGVMNRAYEGKAPDGRTWLDLKYELAGKQAPGISGCGAGYFSSPKFLQGDGGWQRVVWAPRKMHDIFCRHLPQGHRVATDEDVQTIDELKKFIRNRN